MHVRVNAKADSYRSQRMAPASKMWGLCAEPPIDVWVSSGLLVGNGDGNVEVIADGGAHWSNALHKACHDRGSRRGAQLYPVPYHKGPCHKLQHPANLRINAEGA